MDDDKLAAPNRHKHFDDASGRLLYEWEQTLDEVNVFVPTDASAHKTKDLNVLVTGNAIEITTKKNDALIVLFPKLRLFRPTIADDSVWTRDAQTGEIHVQVVKCKSGTLGRGVRGALRRSDGDGSFGGGEKKDDASEIPTRTSGI